MCMCSALSHSLFLNKFHGIIKPNLFLSFSALFSFIAVTVWGVKMKPLNLGWSYFLGVVHSILALVGGILAFISVSRSEEI